MRLGALLIITVLSFSSLAQAAPAATVSPRVQARRERLLFRKLIKVPALAKVRSKTLGASFLGARKVLAGGALLCGVAGAAAIGLGEHGAGLAASLASLLQAGGWAWSHTEPQWGRARVKVFQAAQKMTDDEMVKNKITLTNEEKQTLSSFLEVHGDCC